MGIEAIYSRPNTSQPNKSHKIYPCLLKWRSVKYEDMYLKAYEDGWQLERGMEAYFRFYNQERPHQSLNDQTPKKVYKDPCLIGEPPAEKADKVHN